MHCRAIRFVSIWLVLLLLVLIWTPAARALPVGSVVGEAGSFVRTLCEGDCSSLGVVPERPGGIFSGVDFDFSLGLEALGDGLSINLIAGGNLYVLGPLQATGDVYLTSLGELDLSSVMIDLSDFPSEIDTGGVVVVGGPVVPTNPLTIGAGGTITRAFPPLFTPTPPAAPFSLVSAATMTTTTTMTKAMATSGSGASLFDFTLNAPGDVYLDISRVVLGSLRLKALNVLVISTVSLTPAPIVVPEPATGLLLALGLLSLGFRRAHLSR